MGVRDILVDQGKKLVSSPFVLRLMSNDRVMKVATGVMQTLKSGEGLVFEFTGPGRVWTQTRNPQEFIGYLTAELPFSRS